MKNILIVTRSVTQAQSLQRLLARAGLRSWIMRGPRAVLETGCGYTLQLAERDLPLALELFRRADVEPGRIYLCQKGQYREVIL